MTATRKPNSVLWIGVVVLLALIGGYVGAYYALAVPVPTFDAPDTDESMPWYPWLDRTNGNFSAAYRRWEAFFAPIHSLDRRMRPHVWEPTP